AFDKRGIRVLTGTRADPASLEKTDGGVAIGVTGEDGEETLKADVLLVAVGRRTLTEELNLAATEVEVNDRGLIRVDEVSRTDEPGVYAAGDVIGGYWLAHAAGHEGIVAVEHMAGAGPMPPGQGRVPRVTLCRPAVGSFGLRRAPAGGRGPRGRGAEGPFRGT